MNSRKYIHMMSDTANRGYTLLFAVIAATMVLGVGVFILGVSKKQFELSVSARESMYALYAADAAMECAARQYNYDSAPGFGLSPADPTESGPVLYRAPSMQCNGDTRTGDTFAEDEYPNTDLWKTSDAVVTSSGMYVPLGYSGQTNPPCAILALTYGTDKRSNEPVVRMESRGYNQCDGDGPLPSSRTVERALRLTTSQ